MESEGSEGQAGKEQGRKLGAVGQVEAAKGNNSVSKDAGPVVSESHIDDEVYLLAHKFNFIIF